MGSSAAAHLGRFFEGSSRPAAFVASSRRRRSGPAARSAFSRHVVAAGEGPFLLGRGRGAWAGVLRSRADQRTRIFVAGSRVAQGTFSVRAQAEVAQADVLKGRPFLSRSPGSEPSPSTGSIRAVSVAAKAPREATCPRLSSRAARAIWCASARCERGPPHGNWRIVSSSGGARSSARGGRAGGRGRVAVTVARRLSISR